MRNRTPRRRPGRPTRACKPPSRGRFVWLGVVVLAGILLALIQPQTASARPGTATRAAPPRPVVLAYYYIWFQKSSWKHAKTDYPLLGRYSSNESWVMRRHIEWAKQAGINGFVVSWKSTSRLNARLARMVQVAASQHFKLAIIYEGLNYHRHPLPVSEITHDLAQFSRWYGNEPVFKIFEKPMVIVSGSWAFSLADMKAIARSAGDHLLVLGSEKNVAGIQRLAGTVAGDAYYWSSVDPFKPEPVAKLRAMATEIHRQRGLWIAPAAVGFDARLLGGHRVIKRNGGATLRESWAEALASSPDAVGIISWNEFSENSYIEPSWKYGWSALRTVTDLAQAPQPTVQGFDSNAPAGHTDGIPAMVAVACLTGLVIAAVMIVARREGRPRPHGPADHTGHPPRIR